MNIARVARLLRFGKSTFSRSHERQACFISGTMFFLEHGFTLDGYVEEISLGGILFRPAQSYVVRRSAGTVRITAGLLVAEAELRNTSTLGYGLQLRQTLTQEQLDAILAQQNPAAILPMINEERGVYA